MKRVGQFFKCFLPLIIFVAIQAVVLYGFTLAETLNAMKGGVMDMNELLMFATNLTSDTAFLYKVMGVYEALALIIFLLIYLKGLKRNARTIKGHFTKATVPTIIVLFIGVELLISSLLLTVEAIFPGALDAYEELMADSGLSDLNLWSTLLTLIAAPIVEELAFRGITLKWALDLSNGKFWIANVIQAVLFGVAHGNLVQGLYAFTLGLVFGYVYYKYKSLWASMIAHLTFNFAGTWLVAIAFGMEEVSTLRLIIVTIIAIAITVCGVIALRMDKTYVEEKPEILHGPGEMVEETETN